MNNASDDSNKGRKAEDEKPPATAAAGPSPEDFERELQALSERLTKLVRPGIDPHDPRQRRATLLGAIERILTEETVTEMVKIQDVHERNARVKELSDSVSKLIRQQLSPSWRIDEPHRGRPVKFAERDREIYEMRRKGMKHRQIAIELRRRGWLKSSNPATDAQTIAAAERRHRKGLGDAMKLISAGSQLTEQLKNLLEEVRRQRQSDSK